MREYITITNILIRVKVVCIDIYGLSSVGKSHDLINRKPWQGLSPVRIWESVFRWMTATERILLCMTNSSMNRNAVVVSEVIKEMHIQDNESYKGGSNPPSIFSLKELFLEQKIEVCARSCKRKINISSNACICWIKVHNSTTENSLSYWFDC